MNNEMTVHLHCFSCGDLQVLSKDDGENWRCQSCSGNPWRKSDVELPEHDCMVEIIDNISDKIGDVVEYNGYGFKIFGMYKNPKFWRYTMLLEKRYGKL